MTRADIRGRIFALLVAAALTLAIAGPASAQQTERAKSLGKRMLCMCGCNQILTECNHVGCTISAQMLKELDERVARNEPDDLTLQAFIQEYGERVMAQPSTRGFSLAAWVMPGLAALLGLWLAREVVKRWRLRAAATPPPKVSAELLARAREEADRETEN